MTVQAALIEAWFWHFDIEIQIGTSAAEAACIADRYTAALAADLAWPHAPEETT